MKVSLRAINETDKNIIYNWVSCAELRKMIGTTKAPTPESHEIWFRKKIQDTENKTCAILLDGIPVGLIGTNTIDYNSHNANMYIYIGEKNNRGSGIGTSAVKLFIEYLFKELEIHKITANVFEYNTPSANLFTKCGFILEGTQKEQILYEDKYYDMLWFGIIRPCNF